MIKYNFNYCDLVKILFHHILQWNSNYNWNFSSICQDQMIQEVRSKSTQNETNQNVRACSNLVCFLGKNKPYHGHDMQFPLATNNIQTSLCVTFCLWTTEYTRNRIENWAKSVKTYNSRALPFRGFLLSYFRRAFRAYPLLCQTKETTLKHLQEVHPRNVEV